MAQRNQPCAVCGYKRDDEGNVIAVEVDQHPLIQTRGRWTDLQGTVHDDPDFHFDCYPPDLLYHLGTPETHPQHANTLATIEAAKSGVHGDDLYAHIADLAEQNNDNILEQES